MTCGLSLAAAIIAASAGMVIDLRERALATGERELKNTALVLAEQTDRAFRVVEVVQASLIERLRNLGIRSGADISGHDVHLMLKDRISGLAYLDAVSVFNARGKLINSSRDWPIPDVDVSDRDYFKELQSDPQLTSYVSKPVRDRRAGTWTFYLARKLVGPNGEFLGMVVGAIAPQYFENFFKAIALGDDSGIALLRRDGVLLTRTPRLEAPGRSYAKGDFFTKVLPHADSGAIRLVSMVDGKVRQVAGQALAHHPVVVVVSRTEAAALAEWRSAALYITSAAGLLLFVIGAIVRLSIRQIKSYEALVKARAESDQRMQLDAAINNMSQGLLMFDSSERMVVCNRRYIDMYGLSPEVARPGVMLRELIFHRKETGTFSGDVDQYRRELREALAANGEHTVVAQDGHGHSIRVVNRRMANGGWVATHEDITEQLRSRAELERAQSFLNTVIENVPVTIFAKDARELRYVLVNRAAEELWGLPRKDVIGKTAYDLFPEQTADMLFERDVDLLEHAGQLLQICHQIETPNNGSRLVTSRRIAVPGADGKPEYLLGVIEDVTERARADERIRYMAHHDLLTGLCNRALFMEKIEEAGARLRRRGERFSIFMLDLDRFKNVNDSLGHPEGDMLLKETARRLKSALRETDALARLGGDEFAILQAGEAGQREAAAALADRIIDIIRQPYDINGSTVTIGTSIGIALAPEDGIEAGDLMKKADLALYRAKSDGRDDYRFFAAQMTADADARHQLEHDLREAIARNELEVHYQAIVDVKTRKPVGAEALVRWRHPQRGYIPPDQFIPLAEETGLIIPLGGWVLQRACTDAAGWPPHLNIAVNLSIVQFRKGNLLDVILGALVESGLAPERLELEITESVLIENELDILAVIRQLKNLGVSLVLDDFGTGYSSLSYLTKFPFDKIKIDKSFTQNLTKRAECAAIISSVRALGYGLEITTTAEGVETEQQFEMLRVAGINTVQGYLFGRPRPLSELDFTSGAADVRVERAA